MKNGEMFGDLLAREIEKIKQNKPLGDIISEKHEPKEPIDENELLPVKDYTKLNLGFERFNPLQSHLISKGVISDDCNLIVAWKTSTGKTVVAELLSENVLSNNQKVVYVCPLKALAEEKRDRFSKLFPRARIEIFTGDYQDFENRKEKAEECDVAFCSTELLDSLTRNKNLIGALLKNCGLVVLDEAHIIGVSGRGHVAESALMRATRFNPDIRLLLLSATVKNSDEFARWVHRLNSKRTYVFESSWRPVKIRNNFIPPDVFGRFIGYKMWLDTVAKYITDMFRDRKRGFKPGGVLIFVMTYNEGSEILNALKRAGIRAEFHNASLPLEERKKLENAFNDGELDALVSTTTLAWGCNLSARTVVVVNDSRAGIPVDVWDIEQMAGRAGRTGMYDDGYFYWFYRSEDLMQKVARGEHIVDSMLREALGFQILGEMRSGRALSENEIIERFKRSFYCIRRGEDTVAMAVKHKLDELVRKNFVAHIKGDNEYLLKPLGVLSASYYIQPELLSQLDRTSRVLLENFLDDPRDVLRPEIFFAITSIRALCDGVLPTKRERDNMGQLILRLQHMTEANIKENISLLYSRLAPLVMASIFEAGRGVGSDTARNCFAFCYVNFAFSYLHRFNAWRRFIREGFRDDKKMARAFKDFRNAVRNNTYFKFRNQFADMDRLARVLTLLWKEVYDVDVNFELTSFIVNYGLPFSFVESVLSHATPSEMQEIFKKMEEVRTNRNITDFIKEYCSPEMFEERVLDMSWYMRDATDEDEPEANKAEMGDDMNPLPF